MGFEPSNMDNRVRRAAAQRRAIPLLSAISITCTCCKCEREHVVRKLRSAENPFAKTVAVQSGGDRQRGNLFASSNLALSTE